MTVANRPLPTFPRAGQYLIETGRSKLHPRPVGKASGHSRGRALQHVDQRIHRQLNLVDGYAVKFALMSPILLDYYGNFVRLLFLLPTVLRDRATAGQHWRKQWKQWKYAVVVAIISPIGYVLVLYAMKAAPISKLAPAREVSMLFAALIGGQLLGERDRLARIASATLIAFGVMALALGS